MSNSTHAVFFTACSSNEQLHQKGVEVFHKWTESTEGAKITPKTLSDEIDIDVLCLRAVHALMKDGASRKKLPPRDLRAQERSKRTNMFDEMESANLEDPFKIVVAPPLQESLDST